MDAIYQAIKNLLKSFVNLFVAVVELFAGLINGVASLFLKLCPGKFSFEGKKAGEGFRIYKTAVTDEELVSKIGNELKEKITDRNKYILAKAEVEIFENSRIRSVFAGRRKKLTYAAAGIWLEEEFKGMFQEENTPEAIENEETPMEKAKVQSICEVSKEAIS